MNQQLSEKTEAKSPESLLAQLKKGQLWLARQHSFWAEDSLAASDETFMEVLDGWVEREKLFRSLAPPTSQVYLTG